MDWPRDLDHHHPHSSFWRTRWTTHHPLSPQGPNSSARRPSWIGLRTWIIIPTVRFGEPDGPVITLCTTRDLTVQLGEPAGLASGPGSSSSTQFVMDYLADIVFLKQEDLHYIKIDVYLNGLIFIYLIF